MDERAILSSLAANSAAITVAKPLSEFSRIGHNLYLWTSPSYRLETSTLIVLCAWNAAAAKHIAKYTVSYQALFPSSRILLVRCFTADMMRLDSAYGPLLQPAIDLIAEHTKVSDGNVLVHSFSNGGANQINELARAWRSQFMTRLPMKLQVIDSAPTMGGWMRTHAAISTSMPKGWFWSIFGSAVVHLILLYAAALWTITRKGNKHQAVCRDLNSTVFFDLAVPRVYLYSHADNMVGYEEVEKHIDDATAKGWNVTKLRFDNSPHCGHIREHGEKYWSTIIGAWKAALEQS